MNYKGCEFDLESEFQKVSKEYNNLYGFNLGFNEHKSNDLKTDLSLNCTKDKLR